MKASLDSLEGGRITVPSSVSTSTEGRLPISARQASSQSGGALSTIATSNDASAGSPISSRQATN